MDSKRKRALVLGGNSGIGLAITEKLLGKGYEHVYIVGKDEYRDDNIQNSDIEEFKKHTSFLKINLILEDYSIFDSISDIDTLIITAGFGRVAAFENLNESEITNLIKCNMLAPIRVIKHYYDRIKSNDDFYCMVMGSIAGHVVSPLFSVYGASKQGLCGFIENINTELAHDGFKNRILDVSPGSIKGTNFNGQGNNLSLVYDLADEILDNMFLRKTVYIPKYDEIYKSVIDRYRKDPEKYGIESYDYKISTRGESSKPQIVIGYLSGTFDLFHIGHLNLLKRAKAMCDYLIVGVHKSGAWKGKETFIPFEERTEIVRNIKYVDQVIESFPEDSMAYDALHYDKLFVGSDYKGTERFNRYEEYFSDKGVEIVYFPYTQGTSSTKLRDAITKKK
ncbi:MAG: SDR family NAD(P)-dependent oxidoreductase [Clostridia bacterium]|nr:SDR family NAD(P)-dependent oxidoreductase [Clostridia bacterium]